MKLQNKMEKANQIMEGTLASHFSNKTTNLFFPAESLEKENWLYNEGIWENVKHAKFESRKIFYEFADAFPLIFSRNNITSKDTQNIYCQEVIKSFKINEAESKPLRFLYIFNDNLEKGLPGLKIDFRNEKYRNAIQESKIYSIQKREVKPRGFTDPVSFYDIRMKNNLEGYFAVRIPDLTNEYRIKHMSATYQGVFSEDYWYAGLEKELIKTGDKQ